MSGRAMDAIDCAVMVPEIAAGGTEDTQEPLQMPNPEKGGAVWAGSTQARRA